ncbi:hypothetical protein LSH36_350g02003 [Paralvinella palmiformis]|uniref:Uncharacterized protein n=1 Tax=Paralvinella palmiformis TaxID=53620 RepID=A0AAD9JFJ7_9ANNE|nr:hypothetical protein LSH36_350g02003 [Paralvinella palmiformis]
MVHERKPAIYTHHGQERMYLKRDQSLRHASASGSGSSSGWPYHGSGAGGGQHASQTSSTHRWSSLRPRTSIPNVIKSEPHPLVQVISAPIVESCSTDPEWDEASYRRDLCMG